ncbi:MAG: cupin domain-containing protein [Desulfobacteraceae bacterium]|jgi:mannose-6-phosphate isomerase-like protein (cupin superfamily)
MKIITQKNAPQYERDNIRSFLLIAESTVGAKHITTSLVEMKPGGIQKPHRHKTEQCYMILQGNGVMEVDGEKAAVGSGDTIFIPSNSLHSLYNEGQTTLIYLSAGSPVFGMEAERELWPLNL